eukprot:CAMPEP_0177374348 /NCGR_PEP_ID=MMETSP0368-20130122/44112_1 /TAXON_ID=447022 ORGANISM="Scrippsiella hangoei-like, Strain SHHI-4" /NCGR_SAMPLE_ID=MMETSP0368 /ASSEMBLY_ACC=CAM_ASM_000363 /LENGTH=184 /DNA_ID=CAMNT_0018837943 /DNA_START=81 /DNA_END=631 /DNA_ORIENTATION=+
MAANQAGQRALQRVRRSCALRSPAKCTPAQKNISHTRNPSHRWLSSSSSRTSSSSCAPAGKSGIASDGADTSLVQLQPQPRPKFQKLDEAGLPTCPVSTTSSSRYLLLSSQFQAGDPFTIGIADAGGGAAPDGGGERGAGAGDVGCTARGGEEVQAKEEDPNGASPAGEAVRGSVVGSTVVTTP